MKTKKKEKPGAKPKGTMKKVHIQIYEPIEDIESRGGMSHVRVKLKESFSKLPVLNKKVKK